MNLTAGPAGQRSSPGEMDAAPFQRPGLLARAAPFAVIAVIAEASLALPPRTGSVPAVTASVVLLVAAAAAMLAPWRRLPAWLTAAVPLLYTGSVLALILAAGPNSGVGLVLLMPLVWCVLFQRWGDSAVVAVAVVAVEAVTSVDQGAAGPVIARRVILWALVSAVIVISAHRLRDQLRRSRARAVELQAQLGQLSLAQDRDRIAAGLHDQVISKLFAAGLTMQRAAVTGTAQTREHAERSIGELDEAIVLLRNAVFGLSARPRGEGGLRQRVLDACSVLAPPPAVEFAGRVDEALGPQEQDRVIALLREALTLVAAYGAVTSVSLAAEPAGLVLRCVAGQDGLAAEDQADLRASAERAGVGLRLEPDPDCLTLTWQFAVRKADASRPR